MKINNIIAEQGLAEGEESSTEFYIYIGREGEGSWIGRISKDGGKWREEGGEGTKPHNWGTSYMSYLSPDEVMQWIRQDYRRYEVAGPFFSDAEAYDYAEQMGGLDEDVIEGDVVAFPKKHKGDLASVNDCPKCGGDLQGGKYQGHEVKVCMPCKQVYLPPNSGIDQQGNPIKEQGVAEGSLNEFAQSGDNRPDADYEVYLLDPKALRNKKLDIMGDPMFKSDNLAHACTFIYKYWNSTKQPICVFQPKRGYFRDYYMDPAVNWMDEYGNAKGVAEGTDERKRNAMWAQITSYEKRAKETKNDIKKDHLMKMASELRAKLPTTDEQQLDETFNDLAEAMGEHEFKSANGPVSVTTEPGRTVVKRKEWDNSGSGSGSDSGTLNAPALGGTRKSDYDSGDYSDERSMDEAEQQKGADYRDPPEADYGDDYQDMVKRMKQLAGAGPLKTVHDPAKRVYKNMPTATQPGAKK